MHILHRGHSREGFQFDNPVFTDVEPKVHALVDGEAGHQTVLVVNMGTERTDTVGGVNMMDEGPT